MEVVADDQKCTEAEDVDLTSLFPDSDGATTIRFQSCETRPQSEGTCAHYTQRLRIINRFTPKSETGYVGLKNQGSTCYMNSLLQTLFMTVDFRDALFRWSLLPEHQLASSVPYQLQALFTKLQHSRAGAVETTTLTRSFGWNTSESFIQHDAQELNRVLFEALQKYMDHAVASPTLPAPPIASSSVADTESRQPASLSLGFIRDLYEGVMVDYLECEACGGGRRRKDLYQDVSLVIRGMRRVEDALDNFVQSELLEGANQYACEACACKQNARKGLSFLMIPKILTLQLRRFDFDFKTMTRVKLNDAIAIPLVLDVSPWITATTDSGEGGSQVHSAPSECLYDLFSVLVHRGTAVSGHYFAYIRCLSDGQWFKFNDEDIDRVTEEELRKILNLDNPVAGEGGADGQTSSAEKTDPAVEVYGPLPAGQQRKVTSLASTTANPYMVVYRSRALPPPQSLPCIAPETLLAEVQKENAQLEAAEAEYNKVKDLIELKLYDTSETEFEWVIVNKNDSLQTLTDYVYNQVLKEERRAQVPRECFRLRQYNATWHVKGQCASEQQSQCSLDDLGLHALSCIAVDTREAWQPWVHYTCDDLRLVLQMWDSAAELWVKSGLEMRGDATCQDLLARITERCGFPAEEAVVSYAVSSNRGALVIPEMGPKRLREDLFVSQKDVFFVERQSDSYTDETGVKHIRGVDQIESVNFVQVQFNLPGEDTLSQTLTVDTRLTFNDLKAAIGKCIGISVDEFLLKKSRVSSVEVGAPMSNVMRHALFNSNAAVYVELGKPPDHENLSFNVYRYDGSKHEGSELEFLLNCARPRECLVSELKAFLSSTTGIPEERLRLREVLADKPRKAILKRTLGDHFTRPKGGILKVAVQETPVADMVAIDDVILLVSQYFPETQKLGEIYRQEILVNCDATVLELKAKITSTFKLERVCVGKMVGSETKEQLSRISFDFLGTFATVDDYHWAGITRNPLNLRDGDHVVFKVGDDFTPGAGFNLASRKEKKQRPLVQSTLPESFTKKAAKQPNKPRSE
eukprot:RCo017292